MIKFRCWDEDPKDGWIGLLGSWYEEDSMDCWDVEEWLFEWYSKKHE